nr:unnamed protein product [Spirometra erinaceieuropaei]
MKTTPSSAPAHREEPPTQCLRHPPTHDNRAAFYRSCHRLQHRLCEMQETWTIRKTGEIQGYVDHNERKEFFVAMKSVYGPTAKGTAPLLSADGSILLTEKEQIQQRWAEHFRGVFNRPSTISDVPIARLQQVETNVDFDLPPSFQETTRSVQQLSSGKAPGLGTIPAEVYKHGCFQIMYHLTALFQEMWRQGKVRQNSKTKSSCIYTIETEIAISASITRTSSR